MKIVYMVETFISGSIGRDMALASFIHGITNHNSGS